MGAKQLVEQLVDSGVLEILEIIMAFTHIDRAYFVLFVDE